MCGYYQMIPPPTLLILCMSDTQFGVSEYCLIPNYVILAQSIKLSGKTPCIALPVTDHRHRYTALWDFWYFYTNRRLSAVELVYRGWVSAVRSAIARH